MTPTATPQLMLLDAEPGFFAFYAWQNIMIACWSKQATGPAVQRLARFREALDTQHPQGVSVIHLIGDNAGLPTPEARAGVRDLMAKFSARRACLAILIQGEGFWLSAMRAVVTGVRLLVPSKFQMRVFERAEEIVAWLPKEHEKHTGIQVAPSQLLGILRERIAAL